MTAPVQSSLGWRTFILELHTHGLLLQLQSHHQRLGMPLQAPGCLFTNSRCTHPREFPCKASPHAPVQLLLTASKHHNTPSDPCFRLTLHHQLLSRPWHGYTAMYRLIQRQHEPILPQVSHHQCSF